MAFYHDAVHGRSRPVSGQCIGDPHGFPALLAIKINRLQRVLQGSPRKRNLKPRLPPKPRKSEASKPDYPASSANTDLQRCRIFTQHSIPHSVPQTHIRKNVPSGKKTLENKPLQKPKPCTKSYSGIRKKLTGRTPTDLTRTEIKGRDDRPCYISLPPYLLNISTLCTNCNSFYRYKS